jgi:hypothetical protein
MGKLHKLMLAASCAVVVALPAWGLDTPAQERVKGTVSALDQSHGLVTLSSSEGTLKLHYPPKTLRHVKVGDQMTAFYSVAEARTVSQRSYDAPLATSHPGIARGKTGGAGTTHDVVAGNAPKITHPQDTTRGIEGGTGTTQDLSAAGHRRAASTDSSSAFDKSRGATGGTGTTQDLAASGRDYQHRMTGTISKIDAKSEMLHVRTAETTLELHVPASQLNNFKEGDVISVDLGFKRGA